MVASQLPVKDHVRCSLKRAILLGIGRGANFRQDLESRAYEHCANTEEAPIRRENFKSILSGED